MAAPGRSFATADGFPPLHTDDSDSASPFKLPARPRKKRKKVRSPVLASVEFSSPEPMVSETIQLTDQCALAADLPSSPDLLTSAEAPASMPLTTDSTDIAQPAEPEQPRPRGGRRRFAYRTLDLSNVQVPTVRLEKRTVIFRPERSDSLHECDQLALYKEISKVAVPTAIRDIRGGAIAADFSLDTSVEALLAISCLQEIHVKASLPAALALKAGVIKHLHPNISSEDFLAEVSSSVPISAFSRLAKPGVTTWTVKLLFEGGSAPDFVFFAGRRLRVHPFAPKPRQCTKCFKYNHSAASCRTGLRCPRCGAAHDIVDCLQSTPSCPNCGGPHLASDFSCPAFSFERKVLDVRASSGLSAPEAKRAVVKAAASYASVLKKRNPRPEPARNKIFCNASSQTDSCASEPAKIDEKFMSRPIAHCLRLAYNGAQNGLSRDRVLCDVVKALNTKFRCPIELDSLRTDFAALSPTFRQL